MDKRRFLSVVASAALGLPTAACTTTGRSAGVDLAEKRLDGTKFTRIAL